MTFAEATAALLRHEPAIAAALVVLAILIIALAIWVLLPRPDTDIDRQSSELRREADHAVATRPRVRATSTPACAHTNPDPLGSRPTAQIAPPPKACGGGVCRHQCDCSDRFCPGRLDASLRAKNK